MGKVMLFSVSTEFFYDSKIHEDIPEDAMEVTAEEFQQLATGRNAGKRIVYEDGKLILMDREPVILSQEEIEAKERAWRDGAITDTQWLRDRHRDELELGLTPTLAAEQFTELLVYLQALRDWPQSERFPETEERPVAPSWVATQTQ